MEPKLPAPNIEHLPSQYNQPLERLSSTETEQSIEQGHERNESHVETQGGVVAPPLPVISTLPTPPPPVDTTTTLVPADDTPIAANDDDLIEKEWVDKAKKIIVDTKDDPYRREQEVGRLQVDYLRKRYGKELGSPE